MPANLRLGNTDLSRQDFDEIKAAGGDTAHIVHGLRHVWSESAPTMVTSLGVFFSDQIRSIELKFDGSAVFVEERHMDDSKLIANDTNAEATHEIKAQWKDRRTVIVKADDGVVVPEGWNGLVRLRPQRNDSAFRGFVRAQRITTGAYVVQNSEPTNSMLAPLVSWENTTETTQTPKMSVKVPPRSVALIQYRDQEKSMSAVCSGECVITTESGARTLPFRGSSYMIERARQVTQG